MQLTAEKKKEIDQLARKISRAYKKYQDLSTDIETMIDPYVKNAIKTKNAGLIIDIMNLTAPCDKEGQPLRGDYLGRMYLYTALQEIKKKITK